MKSALDVNVEPYEEVLKQRVVKGKLANRRRQP